ncbi:class I SAM-dependent methyltransferase [Nocardia iowensis]|uniref:Class I SAM-dependent methyltransferase n=1 Tax=Nocardia iowensis TaxID=204891 RepID=A0ABX8RS40_NOCIO|nr:class I SAM-dependent methyltransferase [Nocardia iowensis]QXN91812.1 class I SAM-dependent methyltransferase [Nocardia iowensis]
MTGFGLTDERRNELAALLADEQRLRAEYPRVAEYLDTAPRLSGTGDPGADSAFDLRLVHYMAGGKSPTGNPYWDIVAPSVGDDGGRRVVNGGRPSGSARLAFAQTILQAAYAYAVPSPETIEWLARFSEGRRVLELGAGRGYWAGQLAAHGVDVAAFDVEPPNSTANVSFPGAAGQLDVWHPVGGLAEFDADLDNDCVLFLCWPPGWGDPMASEALRKFEAGGGSRLVYIGEPKGGKTGDDAFFDRLTEHWALESQDAHHVSWWNLADAAQAWVRKT